MPDDLLTNASVLLTDVHVTLAEGDFAMAATKLGHERAVTKHVEGAWLTYTAGLFAARLEHLQGHGAQARTKLFALRKAAAAQGFGLIVTQCDQQLSTS